MRSDLKRREPFIKIHSFRSHVATHERWEAVRDAWNYPLALNI